MRLFLYANEEAGTSRHDRGGHGRRRRRGLR